MEKRKILYMSGHSRNAFKWGLVGEIAKRLLEDSNNEVYYLDCDRKLNGFCGLNRTVHLGYCNKCSKKCLEVLKAADFPKQNILKMKKYKIDKIPDFKSVKEAINYEYQGYNLGVGPISCIMTISRDYNFDIKKWNKTIKKFFETECQILKNIEYYHNIYHFDEIHLFNGRMASMYPYSEYAIKNNIPFWAYEEASKVDRYSVFKNISCHDFECRKKFYAENWNNGTEDKTDIAINWFKLKREGSSKVSDVYTKDQIKNLLPKDFDFNKENLVFFNSSIDEIYAFDCWKHPFVENENVLIKEILEHYKNDNSKHFYLRIHPNLIKAKRKASTQIRELNKLKGKYQNLTIIEPEEKVDSYALINNVSKVLTTYSTIGCEATFWGAVSIIAGKSVYEELDCVYQAKSFEELFKLIDDKNLKPKPKENTYPFGYGNEINGIKYKYYKPVSKNEGEFLGLKLKSK